MLEFLFLCPKCEQWHSDDYPVCPNCNDIAEFFKNYEPYHFEGYMDNPHCDLAQAWDFWAGEMHWFLGYDENSWHHYWRIKDMLDHELLYVLDRDGSPALHKYINLLSGLVN